MPNDEGDAVEGEGAIHGYGHGQPVQHQRQARVMTTTSCRFSIVLGLGFKAFTLGSGLLIWVQGFYCGFKDSTLGSRPLLWVRGFYFRFKAFTLGSRLLL